MTSNTSPKEQRTSFASPAPDRKCIPRTTPRWERETLSWTKDHGSMPAEVVRSAGIDPWSFVQDSVSRSHRGVVRGMHLRSGAGEAKLVRCSFGEVFDVIVDLRPKSPTYGNREIVEL